MADEEWIGQAANDDPDVLTLAIDGWEGPLDLLLALARSQKVDLAKISILELVDQYLAFIAEARALKLELAADYLVMAAWLAYLKSCLLLPRTPEADPDPDELAARLQFRLRRLDAMREAGARLIARDRLGRDVFIRGTPEGLRVLRKADWRCDLYELLAGYGAVQARNRVVTHIVPPRRLMTLEDAIERIGRALGTRLDWFSLESFMPEVDDPAYRRSALASGFAATLELARQGRVDIRQDDAFAPLWLRRA
jgi:segregation and condensation protein A